MLSSNQFPLLVCRQLFYVSMLLVVALMRPTLGVTKVETYNQSVLLLRSLDRSDGLASSQRGLASGKSKTTYYFQLQSSNCIQKLCIVVFRDSTTVLDFTRKIHCVHLRIRIFAKV
jgi:hypothetical protein